MNATRCLIFLGSISLLLSAVGCSGTAPPSPDVIQDTTPPKPKGRIGEVCRDNDDCVSGVCMSSEFGPPFCTRACDTPQESCPAGPDADEGEALCVSYGSDTLSVLGVDPIPVFQGQFDRFCVKRCATIEDCEDNNLNWEQCDNPRFLGLPIHPSLGQIKVCLAPTYHGKDPVDPGLCDWEKTVDLKYSSEANLCRKYCQYLQTCQEIPADARMECCEWGCFNRIIDASIPEVNDAWYDEIKCFIDNHSQYPPVGQANFCSEPPKQCKRYLDAGQKDPDDPTPPAALWE